MNKEIEEYITLHSSPEDPILHELYRQSHIRFINPNMVSGHLQGLVLKFISEMIKPHTIMEIGTYTGYSAICLTAGLQEDGKLYTIEINDELEEFSNSYFKKAGVEDKIIQYTGDALKIIPQIEQSFDLIYIDADKREYRAYFDAVIDKLNQGGFILIDNVLWGGKVLDTNSTDHQTRGVIDFNEMISKRLDVEVVILPIRDGISIIKKKTL